MNMGLHLSLINIYTDTSSCSSRTGRYFKMTGFIPACSEVSGNATVDLRRLSGICGSPLWSAVNWCWITWVGAGGTALAPVGSRSWSFEVA